MLIRLKELWLGICAGILISIGGTVFLSCGKELGAVLFTVALLCICYLGYYLFTGRVCYMVIDHSKNNFITLLMTILGNLIGTVSCGLLISLTNPTVKEAAQTICSAKLEQTFYVTIIKGIFCGILIFLAVETYKKKNTPLGIIFCIPVFILCGFEHSIADMFYFAVANMFSFKIVYFIFLVAIGNSIGGILLNIKTKKD